MQRVIPVSSQAYTHFTKKDIELIIDEEIFLPEKSLGGVFLYIDKNRISIENTLDYRLEQILQSCTPAILKSCFDIKVRPK